MKNRLNLILLFGLSTALLAQSCSVAQLEMFSTVINTAASVAEIASGQEVTEKRSYSDYSNKNYINSSELRNFAKSVSEKDNSYTNKIKSEDLKYLSKAIAEKNDRYIQYIESEDLKNVAKAYNSTGYTSDYYIRQIKSKDWQNVTKVITNNDKSAIKDIESEDMQNLAKTLSDKKE